jgi:hypothetical protein
LLQGGCQLLGRTREPSADSAPPPVAKAAAPDAAGMTAPPAQTIPARDAGEPEAKRDTGTAATEKDSEKAVVQAELRSATAPPLLERPADGPKPGTGLGRPTDAASPGVARVEPVPAPAKPNPHDRATPTATGELLRLAPGESPVERLTAMSLKLGAAEAERKALEARVQTLSSALEQREKALQQATREMQDASEEVQRMRRDKDDIETMKAINKLLERFSEEKNRPPAGNEEKVPWRPK